jgi:two-component system cell cycle response regulator DivK
MRLSIVPEYASATLQPGFLSQPASVAGDGITILVVEDSEDIRALLEELLEAEGYNLIFATNGEEGLTLAQQENPTIILMDLSLPGMDGWEAVYRLRQLPEFATTPIIALTAHATRKDEERALAVGCTGYISKPFDMEKLLDYIASFTITTPANAVPSN